MWLTGRLVPDHKTIADFRKDYGGAIRQVCTRFVVLCREIGLFTEACVAIDGSKFKAVNSRDRNATRGKTERRRKEIEKSIGRYLQDLDTADRQEPSEARRKKKARIADKLVMLRRKMTELEALEAEMLAEPDQQISLTDPDARSMATKAKGSGMVGYNVQTAVETAHHLIIAHDVINEGNDRSQLSPMSKKAKEALGVDEVEVVADSGYFSNEEILKCHEDDISAILPKPQTSGVNAKGRYGKQDFRYVADEDVYVCPAGERLSYHFTNVEKGQRLRHYWNYNACRDCAIKHLCTTGKERRIRRWEHEHVVEAAERRLDENPDAMRTRRMTVEHPFGTIKAWMGATHFRMRTFKHVATEMALHVLAYNLKRVMNILGIRPLIAAIRAA
jgi:transposase